jgi:hypothetical protein
MERSENAVFMLAGIDERVGVGEPGSGIVV